MPSRWAITWNSPELPPPTDGFASRAYSAPASRASRPGTGQSGMLARALRVAIRKYARIVNVAVAPWHVALALAALCLLLYSLARVELARAREDWANACFYSPSQKPKHRMRRQRWQDRCWALLIGAITFTIAAIFLYVRGPA